MKDHAAAIFQCDELADREVLGTRVGGALRPEIADGAKAYHTTWLDAGETIRAAIRSVRVRAPARLHTAHLSNLGLEDADRSRGGGSSARSAR